MEDIYKGAQIYQLILEGRYDFSDEKARYEDENIFSDLHLITPEYIEKMKNNMLINEFAFMRFNKNIPIIHYIRSYNLVCEESEII